MTLIADSDTSVDLPISGVWEIAVAGAPTGVMPTVTVTLPGGSTASPVPEQSGGAWMARYVVGSAGRYVARVTTPVDGAVDFAAYVTATVAAAGMPDLDDAKTYMGIELLDTRFDVAIQGGLDAESAAQRSVCDVPAAYPADLREALLRRVARNRALRMLPLMVQSGGSGEKPDTLLPGRDPEFTRLEAPYRKLVIA